MSQQIQVLNLQRLNQELPAITPAFGAAIAEAGAIFLTDEAHNLKAAVEVKSTPESSRKPNKPVHLTHMF